MTNNLMNVLSKLVFWKCLGICSCELVGKMNVTLEAGHMKFVDIIIYLWFIYRNRSIFYYAVWAYSFEEYRD
jgi:hypothetical protein